MLAGEIRHGLVVTHSIEAMARRAGQHEVRSRPLLSCRRNRAYEQRRAEDNLDEGAHVNLPQDPPRAASSCPSQTSIGSNKVTP